MPRWLRRYASGGSGALADASLLRRARTRQLVGYTIGGQPPGSLDHPGFRRRRHNLCIQSLFGHGSQSAPVDDETVGQALLQIFAP